LNFYSFRKINRERNVWIYKHNLFHRDRVQDLHMVRRRTCPGVDGRKQRFSRLSAQRINNSKFGEINVSVNSNSDMEDDVSSSGEDASVTGDKREGSLTLPPAPKRMRSLLPPVEETPAKSAKPSKPAKTTYLVASAAAPSPTSVNTFSLENSSQEHLADDSSSTSRKYDRAEMQQQSLVVSEVASRLEAYVKKAMKEKGLSRTRKGGSGIVTPPFGTHGRFEMNSSDLLSYDDEFGVIDEGISLGVVSAEPEDSLSMEDAAINSVDESDMMVAPVEDIEVVKRIRFEILNRATAENGDVVRASANVAAFFMLTAPFEDADECCPKIVELLSTSKQLESEFFYYRSALHPVDGPQGNFSVIDSEMLKNSLNGGAGRSEALREFKVFSVNLIYKLLGMNGSLKIQEPLDGDDHSILLRTAKSWSKSVEIGA
ncbi:MAG: hypothetical protein SGILL_009255, partial [Bacillariaceae sp.]